MHTNASAGGRLHLVSAGIGDADHMTLRAHRVIGAADVVLGMGFVLDGLRGLLAGKQVHDSGHGLFTPLARRHREGVALAGIEAEEQRVRALVRDAHARGARVAVVDFGDPLLYGPQAGYLREFADLAPVVVPGISSFNAANALLARPVLGASCASLALTTLHGLQAQPPAWRPDMLVLFGMGMDWPALQVELLRRCGAAMPVALVLHAGRRAHQAIVRTTVGQLAADAAAREVPWASLVYVGEGLADACA